VDTQRRAKRVGLGTPLCLILALLLGVGVAAASMDEIGRSIWAGLLALVVSVVVVVILGWRFNSR
jgi:hypothetical protein